MTFGEWQTKYRAMGDRADRLAKMITDRARDTARAAGLDPSLLGIHPHNAMMALEAGKPWAGVDYSLVRRTLWLIERSYEPSRIVAAWARRVWPAITYPALKTVRP